jgi:phospholipase/carboxylesterase
MSDAQAPKGPHDGGRVHTAGAAPGEAQAAVVLVHGRGATAESILALARHFARPAEVAYLAPQAAGRSWYPRSFPASLAQNEPGLSSGLRAVAGAVQRATDAGVPAERTLLVGFSQGACLSLEFAARHAWRGGGVVALSGGLIGTGEKEGTAPPHDKHFDYDADLAGTPVFFGCSDRDPHIPLDRVRASAEVFRRLGADVEERIYEGMGHTVNDDELDYVHDLLGRLVEANRA